MLCISPITLSGNTFACGQCMSCRINKRRDWVSRLMLEAASSAASFFVTLTYRRFQYNENGFPTLDKEHIVLWLKRFRKKFPPKSVRYFVVGEYGDKSGRPHYHGLLYFSQPVPAHVLHLALVESWQIGMVHVGDVTHESIQYCCGYAVKKWTNEKACPNMLPEFSLKSQGLGKFSIAEFQRLAQPDRNGELIVQSEYRLNGKLWPLPKYIKRKVNENGYTLSKSSDYEKASAQALQILSDGGRLSPSDISSLKELQSSDNALKERRRIRSKGKLLNNLVRISKNETF